MARWNNTDAITQTVKITAKLAAAANGPLKPHLAVSLHKALMIGKCIRYKAYEASPKLRATGPRASATPRSSSRARPNNNPVAHRPNAA